MKDDVVLQELWHRNRPIRCNTAIPTYTRDPKLARVLSRISVIVDPVRMDCVTALAEGEQDLDALSDLFALDSIALGQNLAVLRAVGVVHREKRGRRIFFTLTPLGHELNDIVYGLLDRC